MDDDDDDDGGRLVLDLASWRAAQRAAGRRVRLIADDIEEWLRRRRAERDRRH